MTTHIIDSKLQGHAAVVLRLTLGTTLLVHGLAKAANFADTLDYFASLGLPGQLAYLVTAFEAGGGLLLILGVHTRWVALSVLPILLGAVWVHSGNGWRFSARGGGWEYPLVLALLAVVQALSGHRSILSSRRFRLRWHQNESAA